MPFTTENSDIEFNNTVSVYVNRNSTKPQIKQSVEQLFDVKVKNVNTRIQKDGKHAIVVFMPEFKAEDIGMRIGVF